jgi:hypothetical protein
MLPHNARRGMSVDARTAWVQLPSEAEPAPAVQGEVPAATVSPLERGPLEPTADVAAPSNAPDRPRPRPPPWTVAKPGQR